MPLAGLAYAQFVKVTWNFVDDVGVAIAEGMRLAEHAVALDDAEPFAHFALGRLCVYAGDNARAMRHLTAAIDLSPSFAHAYFGMAQVHFWSGRPAEALSYVNQAVRLNPKDPIASMFMTLRSFCHYWLGDAGAAEAAARQAVALQGRETWSRVGADRRAGGTRSAWGSWSDRHGGAVAGQQAVGCVLRCDRRSRPEELRRRVYRHLREAGLQ